MTTIYILKLVLNKYYIGRTNNIENRLIQHKNGSASAWTKKYTMISVIQTIPNISIYDEDRYTKEYMYLYGIDNVRGGSYVKINLDYEQITSINKELWNAHNLCTRCGRNTHFVSTCYAKKDINNKIIDNKYNTQLEKQIIETSTSSTQTEQENIDTRIGSFFIPIEVADNSLYGKLLTIYRRYWSQ